MVVIGGTVVDPRYATAGRYNFDVAAEDPWPNGFVVFDLSAME